MIPHKLQLKNFLSYGSQLQTIDFGHYQLICLSGKNGHGKSALLDAITWAIWGQARKTAATVKPDQNLLRLGQTHMMVIFDFECNGQQYRVKREFTQTASKAHAALEFGVVNPTNNSVVPLTDKTIKATQEKIEQTLKLDFDSFVNSAFLRQGNANEFSKKSAKDRKEILASILALNRYEAIRKHALLKIKNYQAEQHAFTLMREKIDIELNQREKILAELAAVETDQRMLIAQEDILKKTKIALDARSQEILLARQKMALLLPEKENICTEQHELRATLRATIHDIRAQRALRKHMPDIHHLQQERSDLVRKCQEAHHATQQILTRKSELLALEKQRYTLENDAHQQIQEKNNQQILARDRLRNTHQTLLHQIAATQKELQITATQIDQTAHACAQLTDQTSPTDALTKEITASEHLLEKRKEKYQQLAAQGNTLALQLKDIARKKRLCADDANPSCPLCEQNLSASRRKFLTNQFDQKERLLNHQIKRLSAQLPRIKQSLIGQHTLILTLKQELETSRMSTFKRTELEKKLATLRTTHGSLQELLATHTETAELIWQELLAQETLSATQVSVQDFLRDHTAYHALLSQSAAIEKDIAQHTTHADTYETLAARLQQIEKAIAAHQSTSESSPQHSPVALFYQTCSTLKELGKKIAERTAHIQEVERCIAQEPAYKEALMAWQTATDIQAQKRATLTQQNIGLQAEKKRLDTLADEQKKIMTQHKELGTIIDDYQIIAQAVGKDGIQALLIEHIVPEIEQEANRLLAKLSNNQTHISIESLRDLKGGGTKETLDINISDEAGIRPYELFSGGEGFRIDFALRIAISKLLARRAGTALQTLIIDEGFGSQDEEGLAQIMDAIYKIQDDFARIIIVSHLPMLKEQFPVHFLVSKGPHGSTVKVMEYD